MRPDGLRICDKMRISKILADNGTYALNSVASRVTNQ
jgi:hypothetical protein